MSNVFEFKPRPKSVEKDSKDTVENRLYINLESFEKAFQWLPSTMDLAIWLKAATKDMEERGTNLTRLSAVSMKAEANLSVGLVSLTFMNESMRLIDNTDYLRDDFLEISVFRSPVDAAQISHILETQGESGQLNRAEALRVIHQALTDMVVRYPEDYRKGLSRIDHWVLTIIGLLVTSGYYMLSAKLMNAVEGELSQDNKSEGVACYLQKADVCIAIHYYPLRNLAVEKHFNGLVEADSPDLRNYYISDIVTGEFQ